MMLRIILALCLMFTMAGCEELAAGPKKQTAPSPGYVIQYTADWCQPCRANKPHIDALKAQGLRVRTVDCTHGFPPGVTSVPRYVMVDAQGKVVEDTESIYVLIKAVKVLRWIYKRL